MALHLQLRVSEELHRILRERAAARGLSLRQYTLEILQEHCSQPTMDEWLDDLDRLTPVPLSTPPSKRFAGLVKPTKQPKSQTGSWVFFEQMHEADPETASAVDE